MKYYPPRDRAWRSVAGCDDAPLWVSNESRDCFGKDNPTRIAATRLLALPFDWLDLAEPWGQRPSFRASLQLRQYQVFHPGLKSHPAPESADRIAFAARKKADKQVLGLLFRVFSQSITRNFVAFRRR